MENKLLTLEEIKLVELNILKYIKEVCERNNLLYYLAFGTLLGAIRHGGFIPWDDDVDIFMPEKDLNKLVDIIQNDSTEYKILSNRSNSNYHYAFSKVINSKTIVIEDNVDNNGEMGIWVDVFPLFEVNKKRSYKFVLFKLFDKCRAASIRKVLPTGFSIFFKPLIYLLWKVCRIIGPKFFLHTIEKILYCNVSSNAKYVMAVETIVQYGGVFEKDIFGKGCKVQFEDEMFLAPQEYEKYLEQTYGDYMKLPPENKRVTHNIVAYYK